MLGDEGMYLMNELPSESLKQRHGFAIDSVWADHLRLSSVRFNSGGSGSFISSNGLVLTNHHVASDTLQKVSTAERDLIRSAIENGSVVMLEQVARIVRETGALDVARAAAALEAKRAIAAARRLPENPHSACMIGLAAQLLERDH